MKTEPLLELLADCSNDTELLRVLRRLTHDVNGPLAAISMDHQLLVRRRQRLADRIAHVDPGSAGLLRDMESVLDNIAFASNQLREYLDALSAYAEPGQS